MIINKIVFSNFMAYYDEVEFVFPHSEDRNVTIIYAPNDVGKTCFFSGFMFCLYGPNKGVDLTELINRNAFFERKYEAYVTIFAEHNGDQLNITRTIAPKGIDGEVVTHQLLDHQLRIWKNGIELTDEPLEAYEFINSIIHEDAAKYFFFDGEKIDAYNIASGADYKEAILRILGIKEVEFAISDFKGLAKEYEVERDALLSKESQAEELIKQKAKITSEIHSNEEDIKAFEHDVKELNAKIAEHEEQLKKNEAIKAKMEERQNLREILKKLKEEAKQIEEEKLKAFKDNGTMILGVMLANELRQGVADLINQPISAMPNKEFLSELLSAEKCVCGETLTESHKDHLHELIASFEEKDAEWQRKYERKRAIQALELQYGQHGVMAKNKYDELCREKVRVNREININEEREIVLRTEVGSYNEQTIQNLSEEISRLETKRKDTEGKIQHTYGVLKVKKELLEEVERKLLKYVVGKEKEEAEKRLLFAKKTVEALTEYQDSLIRNKREEVETLSTKVFLQLTNKPNKYRSLKLSPTYQLMIEHADGSLFEIERGRSLNPSTGQSKIISLSYIAGINQSTNAVAPVIIDNPVGLFSEEHRERVVRYLPCFGKQVIFMVTGADLGKTYREIINPHVNKEYYLEDQADGTWNKTRIARVEEF